MAEPPLELMTLELALSERAAWPPTVAAAHASLVDRARKRANGALQLRKPQALATLIGELRGMPSLAGELARLEATLSEVKQRSRTKLLALLQQTDPNELALMRERIEDLEPVFPTEWRAVKKHYRRLLDDVAGEKAADVHELRARLVKPSAQKTRRLSVSASALPSDLGACEAAARRLAELELSNERLQSDLWLAQQERSAEEEKVARAARELAELERKVEALRLSAGHSAARAPTVTMLRCLGWSGEIEGLDEPTAQAQVEKALQAVTAFAISKVPSGKTAS